MMKKYSFIVSALFGFCLLTFAQEETNIPNVPNIPKSPEAASFMRFFELPVSYYTGTADISIPIYTIETDNIKLPLQLRYHNAGVKVEEEASWVGLGWNFMVGGSITRKVKDVPDDIDMNSHIGMRVENKILDFPDPWWALPGNYYFDEVKCVNYDCNDYFDNQDLALYMQLSNYYDFEPDEYIYSFNGNSGSFSFDTDGNIVKDEQNRLIVTPRMNTSVSPAEEYWEITDEQGNVYEFKKTQKNRKLYDCGSTVGETCNYTYTSAWFITKITTVNGKEISFTYDPAPTEHVIGVSMFSGNISLFEYTGLVNYQETVNEYTPVYLKRIDFDKGRIVFSNSGQRRDLENGYKLDRVEIYNSNNELLRNFIFNYDYFVASPNQYQHSLTNSLYQHRLELVNGYSNQQAIDTMAARNRYRLKLNSVQEISGDERKPPYNFSYNAIDLPCKTSYSVDHWGFFNNASNTNKIPSIANYIARRDNNLWFSQFYNIVHANRKATSHAEAALLEQITYPTGGTLSVDYSPNVYNVDTTWSTNISSFEPYKLLSNSTDEMYFDAEETHTFTLTENEVFNNTIMHVSVTFSEEGGEQECNRYAIRIYNPQGGLEFQEDINLNDHGCGFPTPYPITYNAVYSVGALTGSTTYSVQLVDNYSHLDNDNSYVSVPIDIQVEFKHQYIKRRAEGSGGGSRISEIRNYDPVTDQTITKKINYYGGKLILPPRYARKVRGYQLVFIGEQSYRARLDKIIVSSSSSASGSNALSGSHVGYDSVVVFSENENGDPINKTEYNYLNFEDDYFNLEEYGPFIPSIPDTRNGLLKSKIEYGPDEDMIRETVNNYSTIGNANNYGMKMFYKILPKGDYELELLEPPIFEFQVFYYKMYQRRNRLMSSRVTTDGVTQTTNYGYEGNDHFNPTKKTITTSLTGEQIETNYIYPTDYTGSVPLYISDMIDKNIINKPVETYTTIGNYLTQATFTEYNSGALTGLPSRVFRLEADANLTLNGSFTPSNSGDGVARDDNYDLEFIYDEYDNDGNLLQYHTNNGKHISFIWGYNNTLPVTKTVNASYNQIAYTGFGNGDNQGGWSYTDKYSKIPGSWFGKTYSGSGNITKTGMPTGDYTLSFWAKRYMGPDATVSFANSILYLTTDFTFYEFTLKDINSVTLNVSNYAHIDELKLYPADAQMTTFTYEPLVGMTSQTDPRGVTTFYNYDEMGRLAEVRDDNSHILEAYDYHYANSPDLSDIPQQIEFTSVPATWRRNTHVNLQWDCGASYDSVRIGLAISPTRLPTFDTTLDAQKGNFSVYLDAEKELDFPVRDMILSIELIDDQAQNVYPRQKIRDLRNVSILREYYVEVTKPATADAVPSNQPIRVEWDKNHISDYYRFYLHRTDGQSYTFGGTIFPLGGQQYYELDLGNFTVDEGPQKYWIEVENVREQADGSIEVFATGETGTFSFTPGAPAPTDFNLDNISSLVQKDGTGIFKEIITWDYTGNFGSLDFILEVWTSSATSTKVAEGVLPPDHPDYTNVLPSSEQLSWNFFKNDLRSFVNNPANQTDWYISQETYYYTIRVEDSGGTTVARSNVFQIDATMW